MLQGDEELYYEFPEPWCDPRTKVRRPGLEIFFAEARDPELIKTWFKEKREVPAEDEDWVKHLCYGVLRKMFQFADPEERGFDPTALMIPPSDHVSHDWSVECKMDNGSLNF